MTDNDRDAVSSETTKTKREKPHSNQPDITDDVAKAVDADAGDDAAASVPTTRTRTRTRRSSSTAVTRTGGGRSSGQSAASDADAAASTSQRADDGGADDTDDGDKSSGKRQSDGGPKRRRRRGGRGRGGRRNATSTGGSADANDETSDEGDDDVASEIERGGTRMAAKRGRGSSSGNGNNAAGRRGTARVGGVSDDVRRAMLDGPPRTMLVTQRPDRTQIAVLEDRTVVEHYVTRAEDVTYVGNIYMGRVQNVLPGMEAAFLDIGKGRNGVLYAGEVLYDELDLEEGADQRIENALKPGQKVLVQVTKDPMGTKGSRLTMHLSLAGRYLVLAPNSDLFGISRKLTDKERDRLRKIVKRTKPDEHGVIVRTAAEDASEEQLTADLQRLLAKWNRVAQAAEDAKALEAVYEEPPLVVKVIRDTFGSGFARCVVDDESLYQQVRSYLEEVAPDLLGKLELYGQPSGNTPDDPIASDSGSDASKADTSDNAGNGAGDASSQEEGTRNDADDVKEPASTSESDRPATVDLEIPPPLTPEELAEAAQRREELGSVFDAYDVSEQLRRAMSRKVWLPSGGYLIIEATEAMKVIDVNTGKFTGDGDTNLEEVVLKTNLEAADEIVRQLRLRDMGGIIIIDFIDMLLRANQEQVVRRLKRELLRDRTKTRVSEVSRLGLVQMTRKNVSQGLLESFSHVCEQCDGLGLISELD
ncbi:MAG: ribonuclease E/G [Nitriliruptoraceae bacterium]